MLTSFGTLLLQFAALISCSSQPPAESHGQLLVRAFTASWTFWLDPRNVCLVSKTMVPPAGIVWFQSMLQIFVEGKPHPFLFNMLCFETKIERYSDWKGSRGRFQGRFLSRWPGGYTKKWAQQMDHLWRIVLFVIIVEKYNKKISSDILAASRLRSTATPPVANSGDVTTN